MDNVWFTSDIHFFHKNILKFCPRPYSSVEEMNESIIEYWNSTVSRRDLIYVLGDFSFSNQTDTEEVLSRLSGNIHLILGNHDQVIRDNTRLHKYFDSISYYKEIKRGGPKVCMMHYPMREWNGMQYGSYHLYGHVHGSLPGVGRSMDVGVDTNNMQFYHWEEVDMILKDKEILKHHG